MKQVSQGLVGIFFVILSFCASAVPVSINIVGQSVDTNGLFGVRGDSLTMDFSIHYDTNLPDADRFSDFGFYGAVELGLVVRALRGADWTAGPPQALGAYLLLAVRSPLFPSATTQSVLAETFSSDLLGILPSGDAVYGMFLFLRDELGRILSNDRLPLPAQRLVEFSQQVAVALIDAEGHGIEGGIFNLTDVTAIQAVPEPHTLSYFALGILVLFVSSVKRLKV